MGTSAPGGCWLVRISDTSDDGGTGMWERMELSLAENVSPEFSRPCDYAELLYNMCYKPLTGRTRPVIMPPVYDDAQPRCREDVNERKYTGRLP